MTQTIKYPAMKEAKVHFELIPDEIIVHRDRWIISVDFVSGSDRYKVTEKYDFSPKDFEKFYLAFQSLFEYKEEYPSLFEDFWVREIGGLALSRRIAEHYDALLEMCKFEEDRTFLTKRKAKVLADTEAMLAGFNATLGASSCIFPRDTEDSDRGADMVCISAVHYYDKKGKLFEAARRG